ncbi:hypothetical protein K7432_009289 [Basidiobolus ranarum]|uniref:Uncharacterized protein n=1 Tax=Basidiobolus ranarum TaxID=34480 RepID=A0ABR2WQM0_9FUNG
MGPPIPTGEPSKTGSSSGSTEVSKSTSKPTHGPKPTKSASNSTASSKPTHKPKPTHGGGSKGRSTVTKTITTTVWSCHSKSTKSSSGQPEPTSGNCTDGQLQCVGDAFAQCSNGQWIKRPCAPGTKCASAGDSVVCV